VIASASALILLLLGGAFTLARLGLLGVERMVFVDQDLMADDLFDIAQVLTLVLIAEGNRDAALTGSSSIIQGRLILSVVMSQDEVLVALEIFHGSHTR